MEDQLEELTHVTSDCHWDIHLLRAQISEGEGAVEELRNAKLSLTLASEVLLRDNQELKAQIRQDLEDRALRKGRKRTAQKARKLPPTLQAQLSSPGQTTCSGHQQLLRLPPSPWPASAPEPLPTLQAQLSIPAQTPSSGHQQLLRHPPSPGPAPAPEPLPTMQPPPTLGLPPTLQPQPFSLSQTRLAVAKVHKKFPQYPADLKGVSEETSTGVHNLYKMAKAGLLKAPAINITTLSPSPWSAGS